MIWGLLLKKKLTTKKKQKGTEKLGCYRKVKYLALASKLRDTRTVYLEAGKRKPLLYSVKTVGKSLTFFFNVYNKPFNVQSTCDCGQPVLKGQYY